MLSTSSRRALLLCLGLLLLLEFGVARRDWIWRIDPRRPVGIMLAVEDQLIAPADDVRVVILGSSVLRDALLPRVFEDTAALRRGSVLNTSLPNGTPFDFLLLYERNRDVFRTADLLIVGVDDWFFYDSAISERYHRWASLSDRLTDYGGAATLPLLVSWVWQTYAARQALAISGLLDAARGQQAEVIGADGRTRWRAEEPATGPSTFDLGPYEARLRERRWDERQVRYLIELVRRATEDNVPVVLVRAPMRSTAFELRSRIDPQAESRLQEVLAELRRAAPSIITIDVPSGAEAGLQDGDFLDARHLSSSGAEVFTRYLAHRTTSELSAR